MQVNDKQNQILSINNENEDIRRSSSRKSTTISFVCFICNKKTLKDTKPYNKGGLGRCTYDRSCNKLRVQMSARNQPGDKHEEAAKCLNLLLSGHSFDIFAVDVYYHQTCYISFSRPPTINQERVIK